MGHLPGANRHDAICCPERLDDDIAEDNPVRVREAWVDDLACEARGFERAVPAVTGRPGYAPGALWRLSCGAERVAIAGRTFSAVNATARTCTKAQRTTRSRPIDERGDADLNERERSDAQDERGTGGGAPAKALAAKSEALKQRQRRSEGFQAQRRASDPAQLGRTEPESRARRRGKGRGPAVGDPVQTAVDATHTRMVAGEVTHDPGDRAGLSPLARQAQAGLGCRVDAVADVGYSQGPAVRAC